MNQILNSYITSQANNMKISQIWASLREEHGDGILHAKDDSPQISFSRL